MRILKLASVAWSSRDIPTLAILAAFGTIMLWFLLFTASPLAQRWLIERFHLQTNPFPLWAVFQMVPSMYNLENEAQFESEQPLSDEALKFGRLQYINHFPFRIITFFDGRYCLLGEGNPGTLSVRSRYRQQQLEMKWRLDVEPNGTWVATPTE